MLTPFGKTMRKLRLDINVNLETMAARLGISPSYLSAIENGERKIPPALTERIVSLYALGPEKSEQLRQAEVDSLTEVVINLGDASVDHRRVARALADGFDRLSDEQLEAISDIIAHEF